MTPPARPPAADRTIPGRPPRLGWRDAALLAEALATLGWASAAIARMPFQRVATLAAQGTHRPGRNIATPLREDCDVQTARVERAVQAWARRVPWRTVCFQKGLAVHLMLRRRGVASHLHYGVRQSPAEGLGAHVWVSVGTRIVIGGEESPGFARLATYPANG